MKIHKLFAELLQSQISSLDNSVTSCSSVLNCFNAKKVPSISIGEYIERFWTYLKTDPTTFVTASILIERFLNVNLGSKLTELNVHRLIVTAITITEKMLNDCYWRNTDYAAVGAITNEELNKLEIEFVKSINYDLKIEEQTYAKALKRIKEVKIPENAV